jgi:pimeloyl-ACP methyl ester carboxylesterase
MSSLSFEDLNLSARIFINHLMRRDYTDAVSQFDNKMKTVMGKNKLKKSWQGLVINAGSLLHLTLVRTADMESYKILVIKVEFQQVIIDIQFVFNDQGQISGLNIMPQQIIYNPPEYVNKSSFHEVDITVGEGEWILPGTLTIPNEGESFPGVVLVHGSGPNDRDETIGPNKIFKDLAWGLASHGVAVLRYDKRTLEYAKKLTPDLVVEMTVKEEVIDDALLAVKVMRQIDGIDSKRVFLLGHSLGATVAPRIALQDPDLAGLIIMAGITRSLEDTILDQFTYLYNLEGEMTKQQKADLESLKVKVDLVKELKISDNIPPEDLPLGIPLAYWVDLNNNKTSDIVKTLTIPVLVLQGERDYQVSSTKDFEGWKTALKLNENASFKLFPNLNHLFIASKNKSTPQEYAVEGHIFKDVINVITDWFEEE